MSGRRDQQGSHGDCAYCGKGLYASRKEAARTIRHRGVKGKGVRPYRCPANEIYWHIGHLPDGIRKGRIGRQELFSKMTQGG